ncbi:MAG: hypothetical protein CL484_01275 [Acidobacteria bacterium]|nr:hypothetical protein [Acidobacteriota bacterium]
MTKIKGRRNGMRRKHLTQCLLVILVITLTGPSWTTQTIAQDTNNPFTSRIDLRMGQRLFQTQCTTCHGLNATGGNEGIGPDLTTGRFRHADTDVGLYRVIRNGVRGTAMIGLGAEPPDQSIWQLVTYLHSLSSTADDPGGSPVIGRQLFNGKGNCNRCHMVNGEGGRLGPDLSFVGERRRPSELLADLVNPDDEVSPRWWTMKVSGLDGRQFEGLRMHEDTFTFRIMDADENLRSFEKYGPWSYERIQSSTMPNYTQSLTPEERNNLVAYLFSLRRDR